MLALLTLAAVLAAVAVVVVATHNDLVVRRDAALRAWDEVAQRLRQRHATLPALVASLDVDGSSPPPDVEVLTAAAAHALSQADGTVAQRITAEQTLGSRLRAVVAIADAAPAIAPTDAYQDARDGWARAEDDLDAARIDYNVRQQDYALRCLRYPNSVVAARGPFPALPPFERW